MPLRRTSSESGPAEDTDQPQGPAYNDMMYVGKKIPSKTFLRLKQTVTKSVEKTPVGKDI